MCDVVPGNLSDVLSGNMSGTISNVMSGLPRIEFSIAHCVQEYLVPMIDGNRNEAASL